MIKNKLSIWKFDVYYARWYRLDLHVKNFFRKVKWMFQRARYGYCDRDLWCLDWTLGNYIAATTNRLREITHGYPGYMTPEEWESILKQISLSFYLGVNEDCWNNKYEELLYGDNGIAYGSDEELRKETFDKWYEIELENDRSMDIRLQEGMKLLQEHYRQLWD